MTSGLIITGTDTDVGKTYVTCMIAQELRAQNVSTGIYKPVCSGARENELGEYVWDDLIQLADAAACSDINLICPQRFVQPLAPPVAARMENRVVNEELLFSGLEAVSSDADATLVEGVGGLLCPLTATLTVADFAKQVGWPILIVARLGLGTINHTLMTIQVAEQLGLGVRGIILNQSTPDQTGLDARTNPEEIANRTDGSVLSIVSYGQTGPLQFYRSGRTINWLALVRGSHPKQ